MEFTLADLKRCFLAAMLILPLGMIVHSQTTAPGSILVGPKVLEGQMNSHTAIFARLDEGSTVEILTSENGKTADFIRIKDDKGNVLITLHGDGSSTSGDGFKPDEAAKDFWKAMALVYEPTCGKWKPPAKPRRDELRN